MADDFETYLNELAFDDCYSVEKVLRDTGVERTELVYLEGHNGAKQGPYVRKIVEVEHDMGSVYASLWQAQQNGRRFMHLPYLLGYVNNGGKQRIVVREYVQGDALGVVVQKRGASPKLAGELFPSLCEAVRELHEGFDPPIVHCDLCPSNIIVSGNNLTIVDFGISRENRSSAKGVARYVDANAYMPPELSSFNDVDVRSDVYALGALLYFLLVGENIDERARRNTFHDCYVPEQFRQVIERACELKPSGRYTSVAKLQAAFTQAQSDYDAATAAAAAAAAAEAAAKSSRSSRYRRTSTSSSQRASTSSSQQAKASQTSKASSASSTSRAASGSSRAQQPGASSASSASATSAVQQKQSAPAQSATTAKASGSGSVLDSLGIPLSAGKAWNILLLVSAGVVLIVCLPLTYIAAAETGYPLACALACGMLLLGAWVALWFVRDRRPERLRFPNMRRLNLAQEFLILVIVEFVVITTYTVA